MKYLNPIVLLSLSSGLLPAQSTTPAVTTTSVANYRMIVAPDSVAAAWGSNFSTATTAASGSDLGSSGSLPTTLGGVRLNFTDSASITTNPALYLVSPGQINFLVPASSALGRATVSVLNASNPSGPVLVSNVAPAIFTADLSGTGVPAAQILRVTAAGQVSYESPLQGGTSASLPRSIDLSARPSDKVYVILYGTGIRRRSLNPVIATTSEIALPVLFAGSQPQYPGLDQINLGPLPQSLASLGTADITVTVDGVPANTVRLAFR
ncbi:hypothetical protein [Bryobacter aggregatus]|uniref:hypothetical protein n=1 Tax=Bryobacter aggregatus TaxID=360054 RepID=UPI0004E11575|nr:hypothetical protein [Bryobacter aggregatus]